MADSQEKKSESRSRKGSVKQETVRSIWAIVCFFVVILMMSAVAGKAGFVGSWIADGLQIAFGFGYFILAALFVVLGVAFIRYRSLPWSWAGTVSYLLMFFASLGLLHICLPNNLEATERGGFVGLYLSKPLLETIDWFPTFILLIALFIGSALVAFNAELKAEHLDSLSVRIKELFNRIVAALKAKEESKLVIKTNAPEVKVPIQEEIPEEIEEEVVPVIAENEKGKKSSEMNPKMIARGTSPFVPPPLSLLENDKGRADTGDVKANANLIKRTLQNFGVNVEMDEVSIGPSVTRYALKPAEGVKLSKIVALGDNLALALAAHPIRIEAPIPGKSLVGIEVPNTSKTTVGLGSILGQEEFQQSDKPLLIALGKSISGKAYFGNLAKAPHMLVAGATGSGKSVTIHALITSLLYRNSPDMLRFIMIDPKRVELTLYNPIPHQLTPVITDAKKAILALKWAAKEMDRRYDILEQQSVRDIDSYHKNILTIKRPEGEELDPMPYIVIVIDELADLMQAFPRELEAGIVRLAQMSRAVGIHLVISTQRPSVNVITGLIKANVPTRLALQVSSQIDSRTILDAAGAEQLLGAGDMLYQSGDMAKPLRLQSAYVTEPELKKVVKYIADQYKDFIGATIEVGANAPIDPDPIFSSNFEDDTDEDELYEQAKQIVIEAGKASTSYIQRKLRVGYARAARLMDILEERGVIGPADGAKPREVIGLGISSENTDSPAENTQQPL